MLEISKTASLQQCNPTHQYLYPQPSKPVLDLSYIKPNFTFESKSLRASVHGQQFTAYNGNSAIIHDFPLLFAFWITNILIAVQTPSLGFYPHESNTQYPNSLKQVKEKKNKPKSHQDHSEWGQMLCFFGGGGKEFGGGRCGFKKPGWKGDLQRGKMS